MDTLLKQIKHVIALYTCTLLQPLSYFGKMGMYMSFMGGGQPMYSQMLNLVSRAYKPLLETNIRSFEEFHMAILDIFNTFNSALPGKHYDAPTRSEVEVFYEEWKQEADEKHKREQFIKFMTNKVNLSKIDNTTMIAGILTPPLAMAAKRTGEKVPQLNMIKVVPDVFFVPTLTLLALVSFKISRRVLKAKLAS